MSPRQSGNSAERKALLAEAKAWRKVARQIAVRGSSGGLCFESCRFASVNAMQTRIHTWLGHFGFAFMEMPEGEATAARILWALFLALECEDEAKALSSQSPKGGRRG